MNTEYCTKVYGYDSLDLGNNESVDRGVFKVNADGTYIAVTFSKSKTFKTEAGAIKWFNKQTGFTPIEPVITEYTCIKEKDKGIYKNVKTAIYSVEPNETPNDNPSPVVYPEIDSPDFDDPDYPLEIDYPDYLEVYPDYMGVYSEIDSNDFESIDFHHFRNNLFEHENKDYKIIESTYLEDVDILIVFGLPEDKNNTYCIWQYKDYCTDLIYVGRKEALYQKYKDYCVQVRTDDELKHTGFVIPPRTNHHVKQWLDRLDKDGRYFPKKQLNIFGEV